MHSHEAASARPVPARRQHPVWGVVRLVVLLVAVSIMSFVLIGISPIDPVQMNTGQVAYARMSPEKRAQLRERWGTDTPIPERYAHWAAGAIKGDFGESLRFNRPVVTIIGERAVSSLALMAAAWLISGVVGIALGILAGMHRDTWIDRIVKGYCFLLASTPSFWLGLVALMVFAVALGWFPLGFSVPIGVEASQVSLLERIHHLILPALTLALTGVASVALHTREKTIDVMQTDYVWFARSRGEGDFQILIRHGLRNLALPAITLQFAQVSEIFGGSILVEQVFSYPGLGSAAVTAGIGGDAPLLVGIALVSALIVAVGNGCSDLLYGLVDPRIREGAARG
ncbi:ABC transporter permease [Collinsella sp. AGMB00827]|uniref:ABC transporter permease n=1 Tax=Collinsella ureilytica TaxID=2869515 RepID=A0ABS7MID5_9ACTN|nr:ABC transporter permease [Collinsella urealyticum]MBY4796855.1 ABC transporter permease [Collinsella urealyticum]